MCSIPVQGEYIVRWSPIKEGIFFVIAEGVVRVMAPDGREMARYDDLDATHGTTACR